MKAAKKQLSEEQRLQALASLQILDTVPEKEFDDITLIASQICAAPIAAVSLIGENRQWFKSKRGFGTNETPRETAFCSYTILENDALVVSNAVTDERFRNSEFVTKAGVRFYAGIPILSPCGFPVGTLFVVDRVEKNLSEDQLAALKALSGQVTRLLQLRQPSQLNAGFADVAEVKALNSSRRYLEAKLTDSSRLSALGEMAGGIAHEINNPLAIILGRTHLLKQKLVAGSLDKSGLKDFEKIEATVERIAKIIKSLKLYSRNAENDPTLSANFSEIIHDTLELCSARFRNQGVEVRVNCDDAFEIECRFSQLSQLFYKLFNKSFYFVSKFFEQLF